MEVMQDKTGALHTFIRIIRMRYKDLIGLTDRGVRLL